MRVLTLALAAFTLAASAPAAAQDGSAGQATPLKQRTVEDAQRFFSSLAGKGAVIEFMEGNRSGQVDVTAIRPVTPCRTRISLNGASVRWADGKSPPLAFSVPASVDIDWVTHDQVESAGKARIALDGRPSGALWGLRLTTGWTDTYDYLLFDQAPGIGPRVVEAAEFMRENCQLESETGF